MSTADKEASAAAMYGTTGQSQQPAQPVMMAQPSAPVPAYMAGPPPGYAASVTGGHNSTMMPAQPMMALPAASAPVYMAMPVPGASGGYAQQPQYMAAGAPPPYQPNQPPQPASPPPSSQQTGGAASPTTILVQQQPQQQQFAPTIAQQMTPNFGGQPYYPGQPVGGTIAQQITPNFGVSQSYQPQPPMQAGYMTAAAPAPGQPMMMRDANGQPMQIPGGAMPAGTTTIVYAQAPAPVVFGSHPQQIHCAACRYQGLSSVTHKAGNGTYAICCGLALVGCWLGCCLAPFCVPELQDAYHQCPNCKAVLGKKTLI